MTGLTERDRQVIALFDSLIVSYSAGKDSTACLLWALETGLPVRAIFADTGNEPPETPGYLDYIERELGVTIERYKHQEGDGSGVPFDNGFFEQVRRRGMWPIPGRCEVSARCKRDGFARHLRMTGTTERPLLILGQRASESASRAALPDFTTASKGAGLPIYRPILTWSVDDVFQYLDAKGVRAHPAYAKGRKRVGCIWCVNSAHDDLVRDAELYPERCQELRALRASIGLPCAPASDCLACQRGLARQRCGSQTCASMRVCTVSSEVVAIEYEGRLVPYTRMTQRSKWGPRAQRYLASREGLQWAMAQAMQGRERWERTPLAVTIRIRGINRRCDVDNIVKAVLDAANGIIWDDDRWVDAIQVRRVPAERERVRIWVREIGQQDA